MSKTKFEQEAQQLITQKAWKNLITTCEEYELDAAVEGAVPFYGIHLLAYLLADDLTNAKFLWKRIPNNIKQSKAEFAAIWKIGQALWTSNYVEFYKALGGFSWTEPHKTLVTALAEHFRQKTFILLSKAYTALSVKDASTYLGLPPDEVTKITTSQGWTLDQANNMLLPKPVTTAKEQNTSMQQLQQLTEYFCYLESQ